MAQFRTPMRRVLGLGSAKSGTDHFWKLRLTAVANVPLVLFFLCFIILYGGASYEEVRAAIASPVVAILLASAFFSVLNHMYLGMQVVIEDYVPGAFARIVLAMLNVFFPFIVGATALFGIVKIAFGG